MQLSGEKPQDIDLGLLEERKPYQPPVLVKWGSLKDITKALHTGPNADGGGGPGSSDNKTGRGGHYGDYW